jgi:hypothetical protein
VGLVALRSLPPVPGAQYTRLQAELYVERMEVLP